MNLLLIQLFAALFPRYCLLCKKTLGKELLCKACMEELPYLQGPCCYYCALPLSHTNSTCCGSCIQQSPAFDQSFALFEYQTPITHFITRLKFSEQLVYGELIGTLFAQMIRQKYTQSEWPECLIPVPLHVRRLRERGYNQALVIARVIAKQLQIKLDYQTCLRQKNTLAQSQLKAKERYSNVHNAFKLKTPLPYQHIAIVDDVMTTGQTVNELAKMLKKNGVKKIDVWCVARA